MKAQLRAGVVARESHPEDEEEGRSIPKQAKRCFAAVDEKGWAIATSPYSYNGSASEFAARFHDEWKRLREDVVAGRLDVIVCYRADRLTREQEAWHGFLKDCQRCNVKIYITANKRLYDLSITSDKTELWRAGQAAAEYTSTMSDTVTDGHAEAAELGRPSGMKPLGYERVYKEEKGKLKLVTQKIVEDDAELVREIVRRVGNGDVIANMIRDLEERGIKPPRAEHWGYGTIRAIASNPMYAAIRKYRGQEYKGNWPEIVTRKEWEKACEVLAGRKRSGERIGRFASLLSAIMRCAECDAPIRVHRESYACKAQTCVKAPVAAVDKEIVRDVVAWLSESDRIGWFLQADEAAANAARREVTELHERLEAAVIAYSHGNIDIEDLSAVRRKVGPMIKAAEKRAAEAATPPALRVFEGTFGNFAAVWARWQEISLAARRETVKAVTESVVLHTTRAKGRDLQDRIEITWKEAR